MFRSLRSSRTDSKRTDPSLILLKIKMTQEKRSGRGGELPKGEKKLNPGALSAFAGDCCRNVSQSTFISDQFHPTFKWNPSQQRGVSLSTIRMTQEKRSRKGGELPKGGKKLNPGALSAFAGGCCRNPVSLCACGSHSLKRFNLVSSSGSYHESLYDCTLRTCAHTRTCIFSGKGEPQVVRVDDTSMISSRSFLTFNSALLQINSAEITSHRVNS
uniref:Uncharacterized protein n=1 Tax=Glossina austeni TaxID=7395 RepID=A0A1A9UTI5_GLOAU